MSRLLFDVGNTRVKWAWLDGEELGDAGAQAHDAPDWDARLVAMLARHDGATPADATIAAVGPHAAVARLRERLRARWPALAIDEPRSPAARAGIVNAYAQPERLGIDRFLAMVGARARASSPVVTVGVGSALALDVVDGEGRHRGGLIAPNEARMRDAVLGTTARVEWRDDAGPAMADARAGAFGASTEAALAAGCALALAGLVERAVDDATVLLGSRPRVILHGGDAEALRARLRLTVEVVPDLVLRGLARYVRATA